MKLGLRIGRAYSQNAPDIPPEAVDALCGEIRRIKKKHGSWDLVEVLSNDREAVKITL